DQFKSDIMVVHYVLAAFSLFSAVFIFLVFCIILPKQKHTHSLALPVAQENIGGCSGCMSISLQFFKDKNFLLLLISYGFSLGILQAYGAFWPRLMEFQLQPAEITKLSGLLCTVASIHNNLSFYFFTKIVIYFLMFSVLLANCILL